MEVLNRRVNVGSGKPWSSRCHTAIKGVAAAETETKSETQTTPLCRRDRDPNIDPKRLKRILASRQYSQKYRIKQLQYIMQLETEVKALQAEVAINSPRIEYSSCQNLLLRAENNSMKQKLSAFSSEIMFKEAHYEELKKERDLLKQFLEVYQQQQQLPKMLKPWES
ncbi:basic leucine zipper 34-like [Corylus avellana]|uniref:basic leucine zipper 34-like n=1 Tax=Corylus avellana TaxID=13451 RepID=UPI00286D1F71|nr:basic leucine zipper 34-like [Corylus avellana]